MRPGQPVTIDIDAYPDRIDPRPCRQRPARLRHRVLAAAGRECHRQLRQDRPARAGQDRHGQSAGRRRARPGHVGRADRAGAMPRPRSSSGCWAGDEPATSRTAAAAAAVNPWLIAVVVARRDLHGGARHHHRQCRAALHRRRPGRQRGRGVLGGDDLSGRQRHHSHGQQLPGEAVRPQALLSRLPRRCSP